MDKIGTSKNPPRHCLVCGELLGIGVAKTGREFRPGQRIVYHATCAYGVEDALLGLSTRAHNRKAKPVEPIESVATVNDKSSDKEE